MISYSSYLSVCLFIGVFSVFLWGCSGGGFFFFLRGGGGGLLLN